MKQRCRDSWRRERGVRKSMQVGLQMYSVRNAFERDPFGTLEKVAELGYRFIEVANHKAEQDAGAGINIPARELKRVTDDLGVRIIGAHFMPTDWADIDAYYRDEAAIDRTIAYYGELGSSSISLPIDFFPSRAYLLERCDLYNRIGEKCRRAGMKFLYHNHYHEFQRFDGEYMLDLIMDNTDPACVGVELDAYWTLRGALNPVEKIRQYGERIAIIHEKDFPFDQVQHLNAWAVLDQDVPLDVKGFLSQVKPEHFIEVGDGMIKIQDVIDAGNEFGVPYILVEQDYTRLRELESVARSMANFRKMRGLVWP